MAIAIAALLAAAPAAPAAAPRRVAAFVLDDPTGRLQPTGVAAGAHGLMWLASSTLNVASGFVHGIGSADLGAHFTIRKAATDTHAIVALPDGTVYAVEGSFGHGLVRVPRSGPATQLPLPTHGDEALTIAAGPDGNAWLIEQPADLGTDDWKIVRVTPAGRMAEFPVPPVTAPSQGFPEAPSPSSLVAGPAGTIWFTTAVGVDRMTTSGVIRSTITFPFTYSPNQIARTTDGSLWITDASNAQIVHVAPDGAATALALPVPAGDNTASIVADGNTAYFMVTSYSGIWRATSTSAPSGIPLLVRPTTLGATRTATVEDQSGSGALARGPAGTLWLAANTTYQGGSLDEAVVIDLAGKCIVPTVFEYGLSGARAILGDHDCGLGAVRVLSAQGNPIGNLVVQCQHPAPGTVLRPGATVSVGLVAFPQQRASHRC